MAKNSHSDSMPPKVLYQWKGGKRNESNENYYGMVGLKRKGL